MLINFVIWSSVNRGWTLFVSVNINLSTSRLTYFCEKILYFCALRCKIQVLQKILDCLTVSVCYRSSTLYRELRLRWLVLVCVTYNIFKDITPPNFMVSCKIISKVKSWVGFGKYRTFQIPRYCGIDFAYTAVFAVLALIVSNRVKNPYFAFDFERKTHLAYSEHYQMVWIIRKLSI